MRTRTSLTWPTSRRAADLYASYCATRKVASTMGPVTRFQAVTDGA